MKRYYAIYDKGKVSEKEKRLDTLKKKITEDCMVFCTEFGDSCTVTYHLCSYCAETKTWTNLTGGKND